MRKKKPAIDIQALSKFIHYYVGEYTYDTIHNHEEDDENDCCRCAHIVNAKFTKINLDNIYKEIIDKQQISEVDFYCIDRIFRNFEIYDPTKWTLHTTRGYYGEELDDASLDSNIVASLKETIDKLLSLKTDTEKLFFVLKLEYGYLLDRIKDKEFKLITVDKNKIHLPQEAYIKKVKAENLKLYKDYEGPVAICDFDSTMHDDKLRLIDGYHRTTASKKQLVKVFVPVDYEN